MARFEGTHQETLTIPRDLETTKRHFADPATIVAHTEGLQSHSIDGDMVHFVMVPQDHGVVKFAGDYRCRYVLEGDTLRWTPAGGNTCLPSRDQAHSDALARLVARASRGP